MKMRRISIIAGCMLLIMSVSANNLLYDIVDGKFKADYSFDPISTKDGLHYTLMTDNQTIVKYSYKTGEVVDTLLSISRAKNPLLKSFEGYILSPNETKILVYTNVEKRYRRSFTAEYYIYDIKYKEFDPLSGRSPQEAPVFSADDRYIAFAHDYNLYMKKVDFKTDIQITKDGAKGKISNGISDWLYEEEFGPTYYYDWSSDSKLLAFIKFDERNVREFSFQNYLQQESSEPLLYPELSSFKYPKAGEANSKVMLCVYDDFNKTTREVKLPNADDTYIPKIQWTNNPEQLLAFQLNRNQNQLNIYLADAKTALPKMIYRELSKQYIDFSHKDKVVFDAENKGFYRISDKDGYRHIYYHLMNGNISKQITTGKWDVTDFYGVDAKTKTVYYQSNEFSPLQKNIFSIDAKGKKLCLTDAKGKNQAKFSEHFQYFVHDYANANNPNIISLKDSKGKAIREIEKNENILPLYAQYQLNKKEFFKFSTPDNIELNGWMLKPKNFNQAQKYPVVMIQYSGPGSQLVLDEWNVGWEYALTEKGYLVVCVDGRGTGGRGADFMKQTYKNLGELEAKDQIAAAKHLKSLSYVDADRIAIWGWSYGGSVVLWAMSSGEQVFKAGISVAPVTDWRYYNTAYTERFMLTPEQNFEGYEQSSAVKQAAKLNGRLLIMHGTADDNVHVSNTMVYINALMEADKQFEMHLYTDKNHSILGNQTRKHLYTRMLDFLKMNL